MHSAAKSLNRRKRPPRRWLKWVETDSRLTADDWRRVYAAYADSGNPAVIAAATGLDPHDVQHLINRGVERLGMPGLKNYAVDLAKANLAIEEERRKTLERMGSAEVQVAIDYRVTQEAAAAQRLLDETIEAGRVVNHHTTDMVKAMSDGRWKRSEVVTVDDIAQLVKIVDTHSRAMERAIKMVRLVAGSPTESVGAQVGVLLAQCSDEELLESERTGRLPCRLQRK